MMAVVFAVFGGVFLASAVILFFMSKANGVAMTPAITGIIFIIGAVWFFAASKYKKQK